MLLLKRLAYLITVVAMTVGIAGVASAAEPLPWQTGFQPAATPVMQSITEFHNLLLIIITVTSVFVLGLLLYVMYRFSEKRNPSPSRVTHNTLLEIIWTTVPVIILVIIAVPSFKLLYFAEEVRDVDMTIKAIGRQWYWSYEYPDHGNFTFDANMIADEDLEPGQKRLLDTDEPLVIPVNTKIRILVTASDVLHNFAVPAFGVKTDAVPGRVNETWIEVTEEGSFYGQCSELCGVGHSYMPIAVKVVSKEEFAAWVEKAKIEFARADEPEATVKLALTSTQNAE